MMYISNFFVDKFIMIKAYKLSAILKKILTLEVKKK